MFDALNTRCNARFFRMEERLRRADIVTLLSELAGRANYQPQGARIVRRVVGTTAGQAKVSLGVYLVSQEPPFLTGSGVVERRGAFVYLVEFRSHLAAFYRNIGDIKPLLPDGLSELPHQVSTTLLADADTRYERLNLRSMSIARSVIRARTIEAHDLRGLLSNVVARRSVPRGVRYSSRHGTLSVLPSVARIQQVSPRRTASDLAGWATSIIADVPAASTRSIEFLSHFPQPITLADKPASVVPSGMLMQFEDLEQAVADGDARLLCGSPLSAAVAPPSTDPAFRMLEFLSQVADVDAVQQASWSGVPLGSLVPHKVRYGFTSRALSSFVVEDVASGDRLTLPGWLGKTQNFIVTFSDPQYAYVGGTLFRDGGLSAGAELVLQTLETDWSVGACTSEKELNPRATAYAATSLFGVTEDKLLGEMPLVICDDLGDEWADYIGVDDRQGQRAIRFAHCKHGEDAGLSASALHVVVAQALKNLGRVVPAAGEVTRKAGSWAGTLQGLPRIVPPRIAQATGSVGEAVAAVNADPSSRREVLLVVNFISKAAIDQAFQRIAAGNHVAPSAVQILWLLSSFAHTCIAAGAVPRVKCLP